MLDLHVVQRMFRDCSPSRFHHLSAKFSGFLFEHRERRFGVVLQHGARRAPARQRSESVIEPLAVRIRYDLSFRFRRICTTSGVVTQRCTTSRSMERRGSRFLIHRFRVGVHELMRSLVIPVACSECVTASMIVIVDAPLDLI